MAIGFPAFVPHAFFQVRQAAIPDGIIVIRLALKQAIGQFYSFVGGVVVDVHRREVAQRFVVIGI